MGVTHLRAFRSSDLRTWALQPQPTAERVASLGLEVGDDGHPVVTFMDMSGGERSWWSRTFDDPSVGVLRERDGVWERDTWSVDDPLAPGLLDPQPFEGALWYVGRDGVSGDPAAAATRIRRSPPGETMAEGLGLTDPGPVRFNGELLVFATSARQELVLFAGDPLAVVARWPRVTVPSPIVVGDELWLVAQKPAGGSRLPVPVLARSTDGRTFSSFAPLLKRGTVRVCTSPVLTPIAQGASRATEWLLLCIEEAPPG